MTILETERLILRPLAPKDYGDLCEILQDKQTMYAYEHAFSDREASDWLMRQLTRYREEGVGLWAVIRKQDSAFLGQAGLTYQDIGEKAPVLEVGYLFKRRYWGNGYAAEAAVGCKEYAFRVLKAPRVYSIIRDNNAASQRVARRNGMTPCQTIVKHYYGMQMPHLVFMVQNDEKV